MSFLINKQSPSMKKIWTGLWKVKSRDIHLFNFIFPCFYYKCRSIFFRQNEDCGNFIKKNAKNQRILKIWFDYEKSFYKVSAFHGISYLKINRQKKKTVWMRSQTKLKSRLQTKTPMSKEDEVKMQKCTWHRNHSFSSEVKCSPSSLHVLSKSSSSSLWWNKQTNKYTLKDDRMTLCQFFGYFFAKSKGKQDGNGCHRFCFSFVSLRKRERGFNWKTFCLQVSRVMKLTERELLIHGTLLYLLFYFFCPFVLSRLSIHVWMKQIQNKSLISNFFIVKKWLQLYHFN